MPAFDLVDNDESYVDIELNHFLCDCNKVNWTLFDRIANNYGLLWVAEKQEMMKIHF